MPKKLSIVVALAIALCGCDHKKASTSNIEDGLNHYLARIEPCPNFMASAFPITVPANQTRPDLEALTETGLITKGAAAPSMQGSPQVRFDLTDKGKASALTIEDRVRKEPPLLFCFGKLRVSKVLNFTEPAEQDGVHMTHVRYTVELKDVPSWVNNPDIQKAFGNLSPEGFAQAPPRQEVMALTNEGWRTSGDE